MARIYILLMSTFTYSANSVFVPADQIWIPGAIASLCSSLIKEDCTRVSTLSSNDSDN